MNRQQWRDVGERVWSTFWQAAVPTIPLTFVPSWDWAQQTAATAGIAGGAAVLSLLKGMVKERRAQSAR